MREEFVLNDPDVPEHVRARFSDSSEGSHILKITWDNDYPEHGRGYVQWTVRPYQHGTAVTGRRTRTSI